MRDKICQDPRWKTRDKMSDRFDRAVINQVAIETTGRDFDFIILIKYELYWILYEKTKNTFC